MHKGFWQIKKLQEMTQPEWEALCDGCGRCCLQKLEDADTREFLYTSVSCRLLDTNTCRCMDYDNRKMRKKECLFLTPENIEKFTWLPQTCAYRLVLEGKDLPPWHPLISGDPESVHKAGISVRYRAISEDFVDTDNFELYVIESD